MRSAATQIHHCTSTRIKGAKFAVVSLLTAILASLFSASAFSAPLETSDPVCPLYLSPPPDFAAAPYEFRFKGPRSETRFYRDGTVWEHTNGNWAVIGTGTVVDQRVIVERGLPDLRPLNEFQYSRTVATENRYYPNIGATFSSEVHRLKVGTHVIEIIIPKLSDLQGIADGIIRTVASLPVKRLETLKTFRVNTRANANDPHWQKTYKNFTQSAATGGGKGEIDLYGISLSHFRNADANAVRITRHEFGHVIAMKVFGKTAPDKLYTDLASRDMNTVSAYGNNSWAEDFAEGIEIYLRSNAGQFAPNFRKGLRGRFAFFDDIFSYRKPQSVAPETETPAVTGRAEVYVTMIAGSRILAVSPARGIGILLDLAEIVGP